MVVAKSPVQHVRQHAMEEFLVVHPVLEPLYANQEWPANRRFQGLQIMNVFLLVVGIQSFSFVRTIQEQSTLDT